MGDGRDVETAGLLVEQIEQAEVGKRLDGHTRDVDERIVDIERLVEYLAGPNEECQTFMGSID